MAAMIWVAMSGEFSTGGFAMSRQPFKSKFPGARVDFGPEHLETRPEAVSLIAQCIAGWTEVEVQTARTLARMLRANSEPAIALYFTLANERAKREALTAIADYVFAPEDRALFDAIMTAKRSVEKQRNDIAHGLFGVTPADTQGVAWISTSDRIRNIVEIDRVFAATPDEIGAEPRYVLSAHASFYTLDDLRALLDEVVAMHRVIHSFGDYINSDASLDAKAKSRHSLLNEPLVQRFLSPKDANQGNAP